MELQHGSSLSMLTTFLLWNGLSWTVDYCRSSTLKTGCSGRPCALGAQKQEEFLLTRWYLDALETKAT